MKVIVRENGTPPLISTPARLNAPQGCKTLADLMADKSYADLCVLTIDWTGDGFTPVLVVDTVKWFPQYGGRRLEHKWNINLDDAFGVDNFDNELARQMVSALEEEFNRTAATSKPPGWSD